MFTTEFLDLPPLLEAGGTVRLPGSKSISNRVLLLAGLSEGRTDVIDLLDSDDTRVMLEALHALGCTIERSDARTTRVHGIAGRPAALSADLFLGNAGTAMRPLAAALAVISTLHGGQFSLRGVSRMHERPIGDLADALRALGCGVDCLGQPGYPPLKVYRRGELRLDEPIRVRGDVSSQFLSALLLALPLAAAAARPAVIEVVGELISRPYVEITLNLLQRFGVAVQREGWQRFTIPAGSRYQSPGRVHVEGDASSASYFIALGTLAARDTPVVIEGVGAESIQGDIRFVEAAQAMGASIAAGPNHLRVQRGAWPLRAIDLDCNHIPDAAMTLAVMALYADGPSHLRNIASWRVKETDRIAAMATELRRLGAQVDEAPDSLRVHPVARLQAAAVHTYDDHRMAMCLSLAAFNGLQQDPAVPVRILDPRCVAKTFPDYFETLFSTTRTPIRHIPVITVDGPTASGKGTLAAEVAAHLGYHYLDSGALYRATALAALQRGIPAEGEAALARLAADLDLQFEGPRLLLAGADVTERVREEAVGAMASQVSAWPAVRTALFQRQLAFRRLPGLVADGRDMGTVVFPDARLKVFLTASASARADRRHKQLSSKGISANLATLRADLAARDERDTSRSSSPLRPARDARLLDNSALSIEQSVQQVLDWWQSLQPFSQEDVAQSLV